MSADTQTRVRDNRNASRSRNPLFRKLPAQYYDFALQWSVYPRWTVEEAANLLTGCVPHREMFLKGEAHHALDAEVLQAENKIRAALGKGLTRIDSKRYFSETYVDSANIIEWAKKQDIDVPDELVEAFRDTRRERELYGYTTPALEAIHWVVAQFWENADLRDPPKPGEIIQALLRHFPKLGPRECEMIEHLTRHPATRANLDP